MDTGAPAPHEQAAIQEFDISSVSIEPQSGETEADQTNHAQATSTMDPRASLSVVGPPTSDLRGSRDGRDSLLKYRPNDDLPAALLRGLNDSRPLSKNQLPVSHRPYFRKYYEDQLNLVDRIPPRTLPIHEQIAGFSVIWNKWAAEIKDEKARERVLDWTTKRMENVWKYAIDKGVVKAVPDGITPSSFLGPRALTVT